MAENIETTDIASRQSIKLQEDLALLAIHSTATIKTDDFYATLDLETLKFEVERHPLPCKGGLFPKDFLL